MCDNAILPNDDLDVEDMRGELVASMNAWQKLQHIEHIDDLTLIFPEFTLTNSWRLMIRGSDEPYSVFRCMFGRSP